MPRQLTNAERETINELLGKAGREYGVFLPGFTWADLLDMGVAFQGAQDFTFANSVALSPIATPVVTEMTAAVVAATPGSLSDGVYNYKVTYFDVNGKETEASEAVDVTVADHTTAGKVLLSDIPVSDNSRVVGRKIYRTLVGGSIYKYLTYFADNTTTTYLDNLSDIILSQVSDVAPTINNTSGLTGLSHLEVGDLAVNSSGDLTTTGDVSADTVAGDTVVASELAVLGPTTLGNLDPLPAAGADYRSQTIVIPGGAGVADSHRVCMKDGADAYSWAEVTFGGMSVAKKALTIGFADFSALTVEDTLSINFTGALPANARIVGHEIVGVTAFDDGAADVDVKVEVGVAGGDLDAVITAFDIDTTAAGAVGPGTSGVRGYPFASLSGVQLAATVTTDNAAHLVGLDAGAVTINVFFIVLA